MKAWGSKTEVHQAGDLCNFTIPSPGNFTIPEDSELFSFLLSGDGNMSLDSQPPGFVGCVMGRQVPADVVEVENLLSGFCPISD